MKAIGYIRVSTQGQVEDGVSLDAQEAKVRSWADLNNAAEVVIFRDEGISGKRFDNRPGLRAALDAVGKGDALVVYSLSRLSRSTKDTLILSEILLKKEADLVSLSEKIDTTTAAGKMVFRLLAVLSEFERDQISDRTRFVMAHKRACNEHCGGEIPYGSRLENGKLVPDAAEQEAVALMKDLHSAGFSLRQIAKELEVRGHLTRRGLKTWAPKVISRILERVAA